MRRLFHLLFFTVLIFQNGFGQVLLDFSSDTTPNWQIEQDGSISYAATSGNPGGCLRVDDFANGLINMLVGPYDLLGDWSQTDTSDYITFDFLVHQGTGSPLLEEDFFIEIIGPAGNARALMNYFPESLDLWQPIQVKLKPSQWSEINGNWDDILKEIDLVRIRSEFIDGDEYFLLDNVALSFSPGKSPLQGQVCSDFDTFDGWSFINANNTSIDTFGQPENSVRLTDKIGPTAYGSAPAKFRGDWTQLDSTDHIVMDIYIQTSDPDLFSSSDLITLSNDVSSAKYVVDQILLDSAYNSWHRFTIPINENEWQISSGSWNNLMANVKNIQVSLEFITGQEIVYFDNFCIGDTDCPRNLIIAGQAIDHTLKAEKFIILDNVQLLDQAIISCPNIFFRNNIKVFQDDSVEINGNGCN